MRFKTRKPKKPKGPKPPRKPANYSAVDEKIFLKQFNMNVKSYKDIKSEESSDGLLLKGIPVFKAGRHREFDYSVPWIDKFLIGQFDEAEDIPVQRDHSDESYATLGYVKKLFRNGDMVFADMLLIDETAVSRWKKGLMKKWSVGISREFKLAEISAVAFPYIKEARVHSESAEVELKLSLVKRDDQYNLVVYNGEETAGQFDAFCGPLKKGACLVRLDTDENNNIFANYVEEGEFGMEWETKFNELKTQYDDLTSKVLTLEASVKDKDAEISAKAKELDDIKKESGDFKAAVLTKSITSEVDTLVKTGKIVPARKDETIKALVNMADDVRASVIKTFQEAGKISELNENGTTETTRVEGAGEGKFEFDGKVYDIANMSHESINELAQRYADKNHLGWKEAMDIIFEKSRPNC